MRASVNHLNERRIVVFLEATKADSSSYLLTMRNVGTESTSEGQLRYDYFMGPGSFGLDDTHMPDDIWVRPAIKFKSMSPGDEQTFLVDGYDIPAKFDLSLNAPIWVTFDAGNGGLKGEKDLRVLLEIGWREKPRQQVTSIPEIPAKVWLRELRPAIAFLVFGLFVLVMLSHRK